MKLFVLSFALSMTAGPYQLSRHRRLHPSPRLHLTPTTSHAGMTLLNLKCPPERQSLPPQVSPSNTPTSVGPAPAPPVPPAKLQIQAGAPPRFG